MLTTDQNSRNLYRNTLRIDVKNLRASTSEDSQEEITLPRCHQANQMIETSAPVTASLFNIGREHSPSLLHESSTPNDTNSKTDLVNTSPQFKTPTCIIHTVASSNPSPTRNTSMECKRSESIKSKTSLHVRSSSDFNVPTYKFKQGLNENNTPALNISFRGGNTDIKESKNFNSGAMTFHHKTTENISLGEKD